LLFLKTALPRVRALHSCRHTQPKNFFLKFFGSTALD